MTCLFQFSLYIQICLFTLAASGQYVKGAYVKSYGHLNGRQVSFQRNLSLGRMIRQLSQPGF